MHEATRVNEFPPSNRRRWQIRLPGHGQMARWRTISRAWTIGRDPHCDTSVADTAVSSTHVVVTPTNAGLAIEDLQSRNGTWLPTCRISKCELLAATRLRIGESWLEIRPVPASQFAATQTSPLVAESPEARAMLMMLERHAAMPWPVLLLGETGTGKSTLARHIHALSKRSGAFVAVNVAALAPELIGTELFGHAQGAFTGADRARKGLFEQAHGGTLFLDEIGDMPLTLQAHLLRVLDTQRIRPVGSNTELQVDVRVIAATHQSIDEPNSTFRRDLFHRLGSLRLHAPPLRRRTQCMGQLAERTLSRAAPHLGPRALAPLALAWCETQRWPGNLREFENVLLAAAVSTPAPIITANHLSEALRPRSHANVSTTSFTDILRANDGNVSAAARELGIPRSTLRDLIRKRSCAQPEAKAQPSGGHSS